MKIAVLDDWLNYAASSPFFEGLKQAHQVDFFQDTLTGAPLIARLEAYDILCVMRERTVFSREVLAQLPNLKCIVTTGSHNASIDLTSCEQMQIPVCGTYSPGHATAELAMTLIGALARAVVPSALSMQNGGWQVAMGRDLRGATLGILGLGRLGEQLAKMGQAFGMTVQAYSQNLTKERCEALGVAHVDKQTFFKTSDFISIHLKLSQRTTHLVGASEINLMKPDASLINTSRAKIIDMAALMAALQSGHLSGAALDVHDIEPVPSDAEIRAIPNLLLTPHVGYVTRETMDVFFEQTAESVTAFLAGEPIRLLH